MADEIDGNLFSLDLHGWVINYDGVKFSVKLVVLLSGEWKTW